MLIHIASKQTQKAPMPALGRLATFPGGAAGLKIIPGDR